MDEAELLKFMRGHHYAVQSSVFPSEHPQCAVVGVAVSDAFELVFDTLASSRKMANLKANPRITVVIGGCADGQERSMQYEGLADFPVGAELDRLQPLYFSVFRDGRARLAWPSIVYVRVKPVWVRYSDFTSDPRQVQEHTFLPSGHIAWPDPSGP